MTTTRYVGKWKAVVDCVPPEPAIKGWIIKNTHKDYWRVAATMELEDFQQEGMMVYCYCRNRYGTSKRPAHFMALFMQAYSNRLNYLSHKDRLYRDNELHLDTEEGTPMERLHEAEANGDLQGILMVIADAPTPEVRMVLSSFLTEKAALLAPTLRRRVVKSYESPNEFICRLLGFDPGVVGNILRQTKDYLHASMTTV